MPARLRSVLASVLLVVGVLLVPVGVAATWLRTTVTDTDAWVASASTRLSRSSWRTAPPRAS